MKRLGFAVVAVVVASSILGCPLLKKSDPEVDPSIADAATVAVSGTGAKNEASVLRYAQEVPIANEAAVIGKDGAKARTFPNGPEIASLPKGTVVAKLASYFSTGILIMFDDPSGDGSKLIGWVTPKSFDVTAPAPTKTIYVPPKIVDAGAKPDAGGGGGTTPGKDGGGGGGNATADAGGGGGGGGGLPQPGKAAIAVSAVDGKCPDGWAIQPDKMCRRKCTKDGDPICPARITKCVAGSGGKICSTGN